MFGQNGFRHNTAHTSGLDQPEKRRDEMDDENNQTAHEQFYRCPKTTEFRPDLEFARDYSGLEKNPDEHIGVFERGTADRCRLIVGICVLRELATGRSLNGCRLVRTPGRFQSHATQVPAAIRLNLRNHFVAVECGRKRL